MQTIHQQQKHLDELFSRVGELPDAELQSHWSRYLCVLVSGFLENSVEHCLVEYCRVRCHESVSNYVQANLVSFQNPKMGNILELFGKFDPQWKATLEQQTQGELADSVNSIVGNRNKIAHGDSVSLSISSLRSYYKNALKVIALLRATSGVG